MLGLIFGDDRSGTIKVELVIESDLDLVLVDLTVPVEECIGKPPFSAPVFSAHWFEAAEGNAAGRVDQGAVPTRKYPAQGDTDLAANRSLNIGIRVRCNCNRHCRRRSRHSVG